MKKSPQYSGDSNNSRQFWSRVKAIKDETRHQAAYIMGCNLQDIEGRTLRYIEEAEELQSKKLEVQP